MTDSTGREESIHSAECQDWECPGCLDAAVHEAMKPPLSLAHAEEILVENYKQALEAQLSSDLWMMQFMNPPLPVSRWGKFLMWKDKMAGRFVGAWQHLVHGECFYLRDHDPYD